MAIADWATYRARVDNPAAPFTGYKASTNTSTGRSFTLFAAAPESGAAPTTAAACTSALKGSLGTLVASQPQILDGTNLRLLGMALNTAAQTRGGTLIVADRLTHQGGLGGTTTTVDLTTNFPTAALTRYTSGVGVYIGVTTTTQNGTTGTTLSCKYTNTADTGGRVSPLTVFGGTGFREASSFIWIPLAAGDVGVKSIQSSTLTATTGTAGVFGYCLFKPLAMYPINGTDQGYMEDIYNGFTLPVIEDGACLMFIVVLPTAATGIVNYTLFMAED